MIFGERRSGNLALRKYISEIETDKKESIDMPPIIIRLALLSIPTFS